MPEAKGMESNRELIETLHGSGTFQNYERAFAETISMPLTLRPVESWQLPFHGRRGENAFCALMAVRTHACAACLQLQESLSLDALDKAATKTCAYGLCETAVPVKLGTETVGFLQTGQVMRRKPTQASFKGAVDQARKLGSEIGDESTKQAYFNTPVVTEKKLRAVEDLLTIFADHLAMKSNQIVTHSANAEPRAVVEAKQFIREHAAEELSLTRVSSAVNTSSFHFCKLFRKFTAVGFVKFVARTRIENAKNFLLNPNLRITEVGYAVGFQSITHFNRMFKKIVGQSPSAYRNKLPGRSIPKAQNEDRPLR
jgi:AraC-like DNA-binding protein/ligand-binding sensor protein